jgi:coniferyl-aldehyde dehydrogenase
MSDIYATLEAYKHAKKHVARWMKPEKRKIAFPLNLFGARGHVHYQPKGVVGILGTWNFAVNTVFAPLAGVLAAGNRAMLKFSEVSPATAALMEGLVASAFDPREVACVTGGPDVGAAFSALPLDHLVFTGSGAIGKHVMRAAAEHLTPVTLELGGKSPAIVAADYDLTEAAARIMTGKSLNVGQACLAPDYVFVPAAQLEAFAQHAAAFTAEMYPTIVGNRDFTSIVNGRHLARLQRYLSEAREAGVDVREVNPAGEDLSAQAGTHKLPFTLVLDPPESLALMHEELFGPIVILKPYSALGECTRYIGAHPRPLGLYLFTHDERVVQDVLANTVSGGMVVNDVMVHASAEDLPFGGTGPSGMGHYHGHDGFKAFSHARPVYRQTKLPLQRLGGMLPPFGERAEKQLKKMTSL